MDIHENSISYRAERGPTVLVSKAVYPTELPDVAVKFYRELAEAFEAQIKERLLPAAMSDYVSCDDRRKKYRYRPKYAVFCAEVINTDKKGFTVLLTVCTNGVERLRETHKWQDGILKKRKRTAYKKEASPRNQRGDAVI